MEMTIGPMTAVERVAELDRLHAAEMARQPRADFEADVPDYAALCRELAELTASDAAREKELRADLAPKLAALEAQERITREGQEARTTLQQHAWGSSVRRADLHRSIDAALPLPLKNALRATANRDDGPGQAAHRALLDLRYRGGDVAGRVRKILEQLADATAAEQKQQAAAIVNARPGLRT